MDVPSQIGPYEIIDKIASGGMGTVYLAQHREMRRQVALKVLLAGAHDDQQLIARFRREAQATSQLKHPNIIEVYDLGDDNGQYYMAMEYIPTGSAQARLRDLAKQGRQMEPAEALRMVRQVASALDYAHSQGFVHRDIKPSNILLRPDGSAVLADFGIVLATSGTKITHTIAAIGTPEYMSPEQAQGRHMDARSDLYSLGIVLFEMLTGALPFHADTPMGVVYKQIREPLPDMARLRKGIPFYAQRTVERATLKKPRERFQTAAEMIRALDVSLGVHRNNPAEEAAVVLELLRPTSESKAVQTAGVIAGFLLRSAFTLLAIALAAAAVIGALAAVGGSLALERVIASFPFHWRYAFNGVRFYPVSDARGALRMQLPAYTLNTVQFKEVILQPPDQMNIVANVDRYAFNITLRLDQKGGVPQVDLVSINDQTLPVIGPLLSQGLNRGLAASWRNEMMKLDRIEVAPGGITVTAEALAGYNPALEPPVTATPYGFVATPPPVPSATPALTATVIVMVTREVLALWNEDFSKAPLSLDWSSPLGSARIALDDQGRQVLDVSGSGFHSEEWLYRNWTDFAVDEQINLLSGGVYLGVRTNPTRTYAVHLDPYGAVVIGLYRGIQFTEISNDSYPLQSRTWYDVRMEFQGNRLSVYINNELVATHRFNVDDALYIPGGGIGFMGISTDRYQIRRIRVTPLQ